MALHLQSIRRRPGSPRRMGLALACSAALAACAHQPQVYVDQDPAARLQDYHSFAFYGRGAGTGYETLLGARLATATRERLERLGYVYSEHDPDLRVNLMLRVAEKQDLRSSPSAGPLGYRAWSGYSHEVVNYRQGTLRIDLVDAHRRALVWQGIARDRLDAGATRDPGGAIDTAVDDIFERFPDAAAR